MTENQKKAFGFAGTSILYTELIKFLQETQNTLVLQAINSATKGEDRVHFCGQADGINYILSALIEMRREARLLNGLTPEEDLA
jgi:hypothetical protein